jgi:hypothetical protein
LNCPRLTLVPSKRNDLSYFLHHKVEPKLQ